LILTPESAPVISRWRRRHWRPTAETARLGVLRPVTIVTGASAGIGRALAREFARHGHDLLLVARRAEALAGAAAELTAAGIAVHVLPADLATPQGCAAVEAELARLAATAHILVNNAGVGIGGAFAGQSPERLLRLIDLNMRGLTDLSRRLLPAMLARGQGGILNVASLGGLIPGPDQAAYFASKAYVISLTEALAWETRGQGVTISALLPGPVATTLHASMGAEHSYYLDLVGVMSPAQVARAGVRGFRHGRTLIYPGFLNHVNAMVLRFVPHWLCVPAMSVMLRQR
jgi:short-subunit dehydrogenase